MRPRIVVVTTSFPSFEGDPSGHFVRSHARTLARRPAIAPAHPASRDGHPDAEAPAAIDPSARRPPSDLDPGDPTALSRSGLFAQIDGAGSTSAASGGGLFAGLDGAGCAPALSGGGLFTDLDGADVHVIAALGAVTDPPFVDAACSVLRADRTRETAAGGGPAELVAPLVIHPAGGGALFTSPGALARAKERPSRLASAAVFAAGVRVRLRELAPFERLVAHWIFPCAWPLCAGTSAPLDVVSHGADVRALVAMPAPVRARIVASLIARGARFQFVASHLLDALAGSLAPELAARLRAAARVEPAPIEVPDVRADGERRRASLGLAEGERLVVCAGRLVRAKRVDLAIEAAAIAGARIVIVGDGPERGPLEAVARDREARAVFAGEIRRDEALGWIAAADVLVHASEHEGAPTVVREARALGTRVVACEAGDLARWAERDAAITIAPPDPRKIAEQITRPMPRHGGGPTG